jgi:tetratricopeptide (TPR) repeat protein
MQLVLLVLLGFSQVGSGQDGGFRASPEERAKHDEVRRLCREARAREAAEDLPGAITLYREAIQLEATQLGWSATAQSQLANCLHFAGRHREAVEEYRKAFRWSLSNKDISTNGGTEGNSKVNYALSLAKLDRREDAKAVYYSALRDFKFDDREAEPVPFIAVFDPDPEGLFYEYTPERFEAACLLLRCRQEGFPWTRLEEIRRLWPEWFLAPLAFAAKSRDPLLLDEADSLARSPLEREIVATCRREIAEHEQHEREMGFVHPTSDLRPMRAGRERRERMLTLRPDEARLRALSDGERP